MNDTSHEVPAGPIDCNALKALLSPYLDDELTRDERLHLSFGTGEHTCLGNRLAEVQIALMFDALLKRFPTLRITGEGRRLRSDFVNGYLALPARHR